MGGTRLFVVVGMQAELCVAVTVRPAAERGSAVTLVKDGHTSLDWDGISAAEAIEQHNADLAELADELQPEKVQFR